MLLQSWLFLAAAGAFSAEPAAALAPGSLVELRRHTELAMARGDFRSAEMLIETYLPAAQRLAEPDWYVFNGHLLATRIKLALGKPAEAEQHAAGLRSLATRNARSDDAMEVAIAEIAIAQVRQQQGRADEAASHARRAIAVLHRAHEGGRITRRTFERERLAYEEVLIAATTKDKAAVAPP